MRLPFLHFMNTTPSGELWYALQVRTRWEGSTNDLLCGKGYKTLFPTFKSKKWWNGKSREVVAPLFPGYVFCEFDACKRLPVLVTPGVVAVVARGRVPVPVDQSEIAAVQRMISSGCLAQPHPYLEVGQRVRIDQGALAGLEGILTSFKGNRRMIVSVTLLRRSVALEIDRASISPIQPVGAGVSRSLVQSDLLEGALA